MVNFDNFGGLKSLLKFHILIFLTCEESVRIRLICEGLVRIFSDVKNWYSIFTNMKDHYLFLAYVKNGICLDKNTSIYCSQIMVVHVHANFFNQTSPSVSQYCKRYQIREQL